MSRVRTNGFSAMIQIYVQFGDNTRGAAGVLKDSVGKITDNHPRGSSFNVSTFNVRRARQPLQSLNQQL